MNSQKDSAAKLLRRKGRRTAQGLGAAVLSIGLVGTFSLPANAVSQEVEDVSIDDFAHSHQTLQPADADEATLPTMISETELSPEALERARVAQEAEAPAAQAPLLGKDIPAGAGAQGIVNAAKAQLGVSQDCTDLVQNSLAAIGVIDRRDHGGYDLGTSPQPYLGIGGTLVTSGEYAPGDVLFWEGRHNAIYIGNGQAVHGGYGGNQTVIASAYLDGPPSSVVRFG